MSLYSLVTSFQSLRAAVIGDAIQDVYHFGRVTRICPEAPVPVFVEDKHETRDGGCLNVAHQLSSLGASVMVYHSRPCVKHRFMVDRHLLMRWDQDERGHSGAQDWTEMARAMEAQNVNVVVLSDYAKGYLTHELCLHLMGWARLHQIPVVVDPKDEFRKYAGASVICPNEKELETWSGLATAQELVETLRADLVIKQGPKGMTLIPRDGSGEVQIRAKARHVYDVTGAGDVVVALIAAALGVGGRLEQGAYLAAFAAGYAVGEVGTTICPKEQLLDFALTFDAGEPTDV